MNLIRISSVIASFNRMSSNQDDILLKYLKYELIEHAKSTKISGVKSVGYVKKIPGKGYCVKSKKNPDWNGGCYKTKAEAEKRLRQIEFFKHGN